MRIETNNLKSNVVYTAILIHIVVAACAPAFSMLGILYIGGRASRRSKDMDDSYFFNASGLNHAVVVASIILTLIATTYIIYKNYKRKFIVAFEFDDIQKKASLYYKTYYNNSIKKTVTDYSSLTYTSIMGQQKKGIVNSKYVNTNDLMVDNKIQLLINKVYAGEISTSGTYWNKEGGKIKMILQKIDEINNEQPIS